MIINTFEKYSGMKDEMDKIYKDTLNDEYWKDISDMFPEYNNIDSEDCQKAIEYIYKEMVNKYDDVQFDEQIMKNKIQGGIT